ncbi:tetratricopeptide repeat protein [Inquilinus sp.]|uniref:tetratricopeptide repeat protein n=1 Tax=Inquilinus sp. TaxID=1932117 RepID=UPI0031E2D33D
MAGSVLPVAMLVAAFAIAMRPAAAQSGTDGPPLESDAASCHRPNGGQPSIDACSRLIASGRATGHKLAVLLNDLGLLRYQAGDFGGALDDYDRALAVDPGLGTAWYNRGLALSRLGRPGDAIGDFTRAGALVPNRAVIWVSRGAAYAMTGDPARAIEDYDRALALQPGLALAWASRAAARIRLGDLKQGRADLLEAQRLDPGNAAFANLLQQVDDQLRQAD